jgi:hypothetical protein
MLPQLRTLKGRLVVGLATMIVAGTLLLPTGALAGTSGQMVTTSPAHLASAPARFVPATNSSLVTRVVRPPKLEVFLYGGLGHVWTVPASIDMTKRTPDPESFSYVGEPFTSHPQFTLSAADLSPGGHVTWGGDCSFANSQMGVFVTRSCNLTLDRDLTVQVYF